jgi:Zn-dependent protease
MFGSLNIGKIFGISLRIHWTFWLLPLWVILTSDHSAEGVGLLMNLLLIAGLFGCVVLHELGHALMARRFGIRTRNIILSPLGGIAQLERMTRSPWEEFCIAIAGPLVNVAIAALLTGGLGAAYAVEPLLLEGEIARFFGILLVLNLVMIVFNMLPAFPMDGGRVLRAILSNWKGLLPGTRLAVNIGTVVAIMIGLGGALWLENPWLILISLFVMWAGRQELSVLEMEERRRRADEDPTPGILVPPTSLSRPTLNAIVWTWDPQRGEWIPHTS